MRPFGAPLKTVIHTDTHILSLPLCTVVCPTYPSTGWGPCMRINVEFLASLRVGSFSLSIPLSWVKAKVWVVSPVLILPVLKYEIMPSLNVSHYECLCVQGWVETTFLDSEMRVGRGDKVGHTYMDFWNDMYFMTQPDPRTMIHPDPTLLCSLECDMVSCLWLMRRARYSWPREWGTALNSELL